MCRSTRSPAPGDSARPAPRQVPSHCITHPPPQSSPLWNSRRSHCYYPSESLSTGAFLCHGHHPVLSYTESPKSTRWRPAPSRLGRRPAGRERKGGGRKKWARRRRRMNRLVREGASRASTALSFGGSTSFRGGAAAVYSAVPVR